MDLYEVFKYNIEAVPEELRKKKVKIELPLEDAFKLWNNLNMLEQWIRHTIEIDDCTHPSSEEWNAFVELHYAVNKLAQLAYNVDGLTEDEENELDNIYKK